MKVLEDCEMIIIGGLTREDITKSKGGIPILGHQIPLISLRLYASRI